MPAPLSVDLRQRVLADFLGGLTFAAPGRKYSVTAEWVRRFIRRHQATGEVAARPPVAKKLPFHRRHEAELRAAVAADPNLTLDGLRATLGLAVSIGTLHAALRALRISFKKNARRRRAGPPGCRRPAARVPRPPGRRPRPEPVRLPRRDVGQDQHDPGVRVGAGRSTRCPTATG